MNSHEQQSKVADMSMRSLLRDMPSGVPTDCLLARIKGRRSFLIHDWDRLLLARQPLADLSPAPWRQAVSGTGGWALRALQQEYLWAYSRMDEQTRRAMSPFFWLAEVRTLAICLRLKGGRAADPDLLLHASLLASNIKKTVREADGCATAVAGLGDILAGYDPRFGGLTGIYRSQGAGALETALNDISLQLLARIPTHPQMRCYIALMIDSRNLTAVSKRLRWRLSTIPPLLEGGTLSQLRLTDLFRRRDSAGLLHLAMRRGGEAPYSETADPERVLFEAQGRIMRRMAREAGSIGTLLDYLWRCGNEATNIELLEHRETAGSDQVGMELRR